MAWMVEELHLQNVEKFKLGEYLRKELFIGIIAKSRQKTLVVRQ